MEEDREVLPGELVPSKERVDDNGVAARFELVPVELFVREFDDGGVGLQELHCN